MVLQYEELLERCNVLVDSNQPMAISKVVMYVSYAGSIKDSK